ncbi:hypothetical protein IMY05_011G0027000 [Salix suchowensis]|nr:hypothetical protein IMY05_011G0027000 [Salix suchowensis]
MLILHFVEEKKIDTIVGGITSSRSKKNQRKMSYFIRNCVEAGLAGIEGQTSHDSKSNSTFQSWNSRKKSYFSGGSGDRDGESKRKQTEESFQRVMYMSCWTQGC